MLLFTVSTDGCKPQKPLTFDQMISDITMLLLQNPQEQKYRTDRLSRSMLLEHQSRVLFAHTLRAPSSCMKEGQSKFTDVWKRENSRATRLQD